MGAIAAAKVSAPNAALRVIDAAVQVHGGAGVSQVRLSSLPVHSDWGPGAYLCTNSDTLIRSHYHKILSIL